MKDNFADQVWDERDPSPWLALYLDQSTPLPDAVKAAWLHDCSGGSRQFFLPLLRPGDQVHVSWAPDASLVLPAIFMAWHVKRARYKQSFPRHISRRKPRLIR